MDLVKLKNSISIKDDSDLELSRWYRNRMKTRRSIRLFTNEKVKDEIVLNAIETAISAPSGANRQPWHFSVVSNPHLKCQLRNAAENVEHTFYNDPKNKDWAGDLSFLKVCDRKPFLEINSHLIVVSVRTQVAPLESNYCTTRSYYPKESTSIAIGLLLSSLHLSGVGTLTHTPRPTDFISEILRLDQHTKPLMIIALGYPDPNHELISLEKRPFNEIATFFD